MRNGRRGRKQHYRRNEELRQERKYNKRKRKKNRVRRKSWIPDSSDEWDEMAETPVERIMPRGEQERRRSVPAEALATLEA